MAFYIPRTMATMQMAQPQQMRQGTNPIPQGTTATTQQQQSVSPAQAMGGATSMYRMGQGGAKAFHDANNFYDAMTMPSGVNSAGIASPMYSPAAANANFMAGGSSAFPQGAMNGTGAAELMGGAQVAENPLLAPTVSGSFAAPVEGANAALGSSLLDAGATEGAATGASLLGGEAAATAGATAAAEGAAAGAAGTAAAEGAGALGLEAAGLGALGPIGIIAGAGLLGSKLFGMW